MGDLRLVGASNVKITGFGAFDGNFTIEKATHTVSGGYTTKLDLSMNKESKKELRKKKKSKAKKASSRKKTATTTDTVTRTYQGENQVILKNNG